MTTPFDPEAFAAGDPRTPPAELTRIANTRPDLHSVLYTNPSTHLELKQWLEVYFPEAVRHAVTFEATAGLVATTQKYTTDQFAVSSQSTMSNPSYPLNQSGPGAQGGQETRSVVSSQAGIPGQKLEGRRRVAAWVALGAAVSVLAVGIVFGVLHLRSDDSAQPTPTATRMSSVEDWESVGRTEEEGTSSIEPESTMPSPTEDSESLGSRLPALGPRTPSSAQTSAKAKGYLLVDSDSTNFSCEMYSDWAGCSILERSYSDNGQEDCTDRLFSISYRAGTVGKACGQKFLGKQGDQVRTLSIGDGVTYGNIQCELTWEGGLETVTCSNLDGQVFFSFNSARYSFG